MLSIKFKLAIPAAIFGLFLTALVTFYQAQASSREVPGFDGIHCDFTPWLSCRLSASSEALWHEKKYSDPTRLVINAGKLYISNSTRVTSHDLRSGQVIWQRSSSNDASYFYPVLDGQWLYLARSDGNLEKVSAASGQLAWSRHFGSGWIYPPLVQDERLVTGGQDRVLRLLDTRNGSELYRIELDQELVAPLFPAGTLLIASTFDGQLQAWHIDPKQGNLNKLWSTRLATPAFSFNHGSGSLIAADMGGTLHSIDPGNGDTNWQQRVYHNALYWNILDDQRLISLGESGVLNILDMHTGGRRHTLQLPGRYDQAPVVRGQRLVLYDQTGTAQRVTAGELYGHPESSLSMSN